MEKETYILALSCVDDFGIVAVVSSFLTNHTAFIKESAQFSDPASFQFFMRIVFEAPSTHYENIQAGFIKIAKKFSMTWSMQRLAYKPKVLLMVSKSGHCLQDILHKTTSNSLPITVSAIVSNHKHLEKLSLWYNVPFHYMPISESTKLSQEKALLNLIEKESIDLVVLARYMQILSSDLCTIMSGKVINIHHSFLPSFKGAKPYHQAYERGVKVIGATAHYVTKDLDEGPIIEQETLHVHHGHSPEQLIALGEDIESSVLTNAIRFHAEKRILLNGHKTVVFKP